MDFYQFTVLNEGKDFGSYLTCHCPSLSDCISGAAIAKQADKKTAASFPATVFVNRMRRSEDYFVP